MTIAETVNTRELLRANGQMTADDVKALEEAISGPQLAELRNELQSLESEAGGSPSEATLTRMGVASFLLGRHKQAGEYLSQVSGDPLAMYYRAQATRARGDAAQAEADFAAAAELGYDRVECVFQQAAAIREQGRLDEAEEMVRSVASQGAGRADYSYQIGCIRADRGDTHGAIEMFERAVDMDPHHSQALFRLANINALYGNDEEAIRLYEQSLSRPPHYLGALLNLGLLYEDKENYAAAEYCFRRVLDVNPSHQRALLYLKDIEATSDMYYDEESARDEARMRQLLSRPVTDFELSVRSRNCLQGMNIYTLGDLTEVSEQELLSGKNFGETSLHEIRDMMTQHGLRIGQNLHQAKATETRYQPQNLSPEEQALLNKPMSELNLSVRARKCMTRLGITSIGELVQRTPDELLSSRNFGVTSLNEIRSKLGEMNLKLRND